VQVSDIVKALNLTPVVQGVSLEAEVNGGFASDMLSIVMGEGAPGQVWVTMQGHHNVVAVASLIGLSAVIVAGGSAVEPDTIAKAEQNKVVILTTELPSFTVIGKLYELGVGK
jgi:hypothetical protein